MASATKQGISSMGVDVKVNSVAMNYVKDIGDIGGTPSELDATCLKDSMKITVPGIQDAKAFDVTYLYDNSSADSDFRKIKALEEDGAIVPIEVKLPDNTTYSSTGYVNTYISGVKTDALIEAKLSVSLQSAWTRTDPTSGT